MSECDSSDHPVSVVVVGVVVVFVNFLLFRLLFSKRCMDLLQIFMLMFLGWTPTEFVKIGMLTLFCMELWVILCKFWPILKNLLL